MIIFNIKTWSVRKTNSSWARIIHKTYDFKNTIIISALKKGYITSSPRLQFWKHSPGFWLKLNPTTEKQLFRMDLSVFSEFLGFFFFCTQVLQLRDNNFYWKPSAVNYFQRNTIISIPLKWHIRQCSVPIAF